VSNQKAKFVPREHDNHHRITPYVIVFGVAGDFNHTYEKISHLVASLPTSRQQVVFALQLVPSCQQVWNKLLTICNNLVDIIRLVTRLFQQVRYSHDIAVLLQPCVVNLVTFLFIMTVSDLLEQPCQACYKLLTACSKLVTATRNKQCEHNLSTACEQICNNLFADL
jgi:hypothetical protein